MKQLFILGFAASLFVVLAAPTAYAADMTPGSQSRESITLSPVSKKYEIEAGATQEGTVTIINDGTVDYDFTMYTRPYTVTNEGYTPDFTKTADNTDIYQWVQFPKAKFHLKAGESTEVPYVLRVPQTAKPGGHYGVIFAETQPANEVQGSAVVRKKRVGSILYATVKGDVNLKGSLESVSIPFWQTGAPLTAVSRVKNEGNTDFSTMTTYRIKDIFGNIKHDVKTEYPVLPQTIRRITSEWTGAAWIGVYRVELTQQYLQDHKTTTGYVLIIPRYLVILSVALVLIGGGIALRRRLKK